MSAPVRTARRLALALAVVAAPAAEARPGATAATPRDPVAAGRRIYRDGVLPSGAPLEGTAQQGIVRRGADASCAACHRRSGFGASEGPIRIPAIAGPVLFGSRDPPKAPGSPLSPAVKTAPANPEVAARAARLAAHTARLARIAAQRGSERRPPYDDASLARAIRDGVDVAGRPLAPGMPRYALRDDELRALVAYLRTLSQDAAPGVTDEELHLATVVQPGVAPAKRRAMLEVLQAFVRDKNAGTRSEEQRRLAGTEREYRAWRRWVLHVWELSGPADGWGAQLDALYARDPVFALVGGLGTTSWRPVHDWSEALGVPCLFPQVELPATSGPGFYTVYLSKGIALEAEALARFLADRATPAPVVQVFRRDGPSAAAAVAFRAALRAAGAPAPDERAVDGPLPAGLWDELAATPGATVVLWLGPADLAGAGALVAERSAARSVFLSATLAGEDPGALARDGRVRLVHPLDLPRARSARLLRVKRWLHEKGIALTDEAVQMNAYFAVAVTADVVSHLADLHSRELLVERVEHAVGNTVAPSLYPRPSLGPDQRFASKGSFVVRLTDAGDVEPVSGWITP